jgi:hypothetical protein
MSSPLSSNLITHGSSSALTNDIRGLKAPIEIPNPWLWMAWLAAALVAAVLCWWAWKRWHRAKEVKAPEIIVPPHDRAREKLRAALALIAEPRPFCIAVSDTIRVYLEERFRLHAPERTTEEFLDELQKSATLSFDQKQTLGEFLQRCDLVKFARYEPGEPELRELYEAAVRLVAETEPFQSTPGTPDQPPGSRSQSQTA